MDMVLVFTRMKHSADRVARKLESLGIKTGALHSNRSQNQRLKALKDFKSGEVRVLVATDIAARGIDVHGIGRTGRANAVGDAISFVTPEDHGELRALERFIGRGIVRKRAEGFDYNAAAAPGDAMDRGPRGPRQPQGRRGQSSGRGGGGGGSRKPRPSTPQSGSWSPGGRSSGGGRR